MLKVNIIIALCIFGAVQANFVHKGECPQRPVQSDFNLEKFQGQWFEIKSSPPTLHDIDCSTGTINQTADGLIFKHEGMKEDGTHFRNLLRAVIVDTGKISVGYFGEIPDAQKANYHVLATDYTNYAIGWNCKQIQINYVEMFWVLSRTKTLDASFYEDYLTSNSIDKGEFRTIDHSAKCNV